MASYPTRMAKKHLARNLLRNYTIIMLTFEWDEKKRESNIDKHGVDFASIESLFAGVTVTLLDDRFSHEEERFITFGLLDSIVVAVAHTENDEVIRIISARKGTRNEEKAYFKTIRG